MLQQLPEEILLIIYNQLNFYTKLSLAKTCRKFRDSLYNTVLYEDIRIPERHAHKVMMRFKNGELDGSRVKCCDIHHVALNPKFFCELPDIFPNVKKLTFPYKTYDRHYPSDYSPVFEMRDRLEECGRFVGDCVFALLPISRFDQLKQLVLNVSCHKQTIQNLENAPNLESLTLYGFKINFEFLETLHLHAPKLKRLAMFDIQLLFNIIRTPKEELQPAKYLHDFHMLSNNNYCDQNSFLIQYLVLKYPNLRSLQLYNKDNIFTPRRNEEFLESLKQLISRLDEFKINFYLMEDRSTGITHLVGRGFRMLFPDLLHTISRKRRIRDLCLEHSNITTLSIPIVYTPLIYHKKSHFPHIKSLHLFSPGFPAADDQCIYLDELLYTYSGLETLEISSEYNIIAVQETKTCFYPLLHNIKLILLSIGSNTFDFIRECVPNVTEIYLETMEKFKAFRLELPEHTLHLLTLNIFWPDDIDRRWKFAYKINTENGCRKFKYLHRGEWNIKVVEKSGIDIGYFKGGCVEILCKRLLLLKHNDNSVI